MLEFGVEEYDRCGGHDADNILWRYSWSDERLEKYTMM